MPGSSPFRIELSTDARQWQGRERYEDEFVLSTDEKTSIQARLRTHPSLPVVAGQPMRVEHE